MKPTLIVYATRAGHTRWIAEHMAESLLRRGVFVEVGNAAHLAGDLDLARCYEAVILAASVHRGRHEHELVRFVKRHRDALERMPTAFLSVSLSQAAAELAGSSPVKKERAARDVEAALERFREDTGWTSPRTLAVAGALPYRRFRQPLRWVMRAMARAKGLPDDAYRDYAWTNWGELDRLADALADELSQIAARASSTATA